MIITELTRNNHNYLIIDHLSTLPSYDKVLLTTSHNNGVPKGSMSARCYTDGVKYNIEGRITGGGRIVISGGSLSVSYTDDIGFEVTSIDVSDENVDQLFSMIFTTTNSSSWYAFLFGETPNSAIHLTDRDIYSFLHDHDYNGFTGGIQIYDNGVLTYTKDTSFIWNGLPYSRSKYQNDEEYNIVMNKLLSLTGAQLTATDSGEHAVASDKTSLDCLRALSGVPSFTYKTLSITMKSMTIDGDVFSTARDDSGSYYLCDVGQIPTLHNNLDWLRELTRCKLDSITEMLNIINHGYDATHVVEYYANAPIEVNFNDSLSRIRGYTIDTTDIIRNSIDKMYYDGHHLLIDAEPSNEVQAIDNVINTTGYVSSVSNEVAYQKLFDKMTRRGTIGIFSYNYSPFAGYAAKPLTFLMTGYTDHKLYGTFVVRPALFRSVYMSNAKMDEIVNKVFSKICQRFSFNIEILSKNRTFADPYVGSEMRRMYCGINDALNAFWQGKIPFERLDEVFREINSFYIFDDVELGYWYWDLIEWAYRRYRGDAMLHVAGDTSFYTVCPVYVYKVAIDLSDLPYQVRTPAMDYGLIVDLLDDDKKALFQRLFIDNTLCVSRAATLYPFHILFRIEDSSIPEEIKQQLSHVDDVAICCDMEYGEFKNEISHGGAFYATIV